MCVCAVRVCECVCVYTCVDVDIRGLLQLALWVEWFSGVGWTQFVQRACLYVYFLPFEVSKGKNLT